MLWLGIAIGVIVTLAAIRGLDWLTDYFMGAT